MRTRRTPRATLPTPTVSLSPEALRTAQSTLRWTSQQRQNPSEADRSPLECRKLPSRKTVTPGPPDNSDDAKLFRLNFDFEDPPPTRKVNSAAKPSTPQKSKTPLQWGASDLKTSSRLAKRPIYSVKYFGITDGDFGVLTRKRLMPVISPIEACASTPLAVMTTVDRYRTSKIIKEVASAHPRPSTHSPTSPMRPEEKSQGKATPELCDNSQLIPEEYLQPTPSKYDRHLVHTYARPRGLMKAEATDTLGKCSPFYIERDRRTAEVKEFMTRYEAAKHKVYQVTLQRKEIRGWKLTQPKAGRKAGGQGEEEGEGVSVFKPPPLI